jgi:SanA protein
MVLYRQNKPKPKRIWKLLAVIFTFISLTVLGINLYIVGSTKTCISNQVSSLPQLGFALVMGTDMLRFNGSTNLHFLNRTEGAATIYLSGKVRHLLISGNKDNKGFNEVTGMEEKILSKGIPKDVLILDFDGNTSWESVRRAKEVYHLEKIIVITDAFHAPRAIFLCRHFGIDAVAFCYGKESFGFWSLRYDIREWLACVKAVFQVLIDRKIQNE